LDLTRTYLEDKYKVKGSDFVKEKIAVLIEQYIKEISDKYGFEPLRYDLHLDEGVYKEGVFKRNIHAHISFYNYNYKARRGYLDDLKAFNDGNTSLKPEKPEFVPLNPIKKKQKDEHGKLKVNDAFSEFQDIAGDVFFKAGFFRGIKKSITNAEHLNRDDYIKKIQDAVESAVNKAVLKLSMIKQNFTSWLDRIISDDGGDDEVPTEQLATEIANDLDDITDDLPSEMDKLDTVIVQKEQKYNTPEKNKITPKRKRRRRKKTDE